MSNLFKPAVRSKQKLRLLLEGASGSGKTYSALLIAKSLAQKENKKVAFIDTEFGSASLYAGKFEFDTLELSPPFTPEKYIEAIQTAGSSGEYGVLIVDSISHEWSGEGGCLDIQSKLGGTFNDWKKVTPRHQAFINAILKANIHIIGCARTKSDYVMEEGTNKSGKITTKPVKVGTKTEQREGLEFEFTTIFRLNQNHVASVSKDRTSLFETRDEIITEETGDILYQWLTTGEDTVLNTPVDDTEYHLTLDAIEDISMLKQFYEESKELVNDKKTFYNAVVKRQKELKQKRGE